LDREIPEYKGVMKRFGDMAELEEEITRALSLGDKKAADTILRKLITGIREDSGLRRDLMAELKDVSGKDIQGMVSGYLANPIEGAGYVSKAAQNLGILGSIFAAPKYIALFAASSPRLFGEFLNILGKGERAVKTVAKAVPGPGVRLGAFQAGRVGLMPEMEQ
jgi:hypothetical protein